MKYTMVIEEGDTSFGVFFPEFPGCISVGDTFEEAIQMGKESLSLHLEDEAELPAPKSLQELADAGEVDLNDDTLSFVRINFDAI